MKTMIFSNRQEIIDAAIELLIKKIKMHQGQFFVLGLSTGSTVLSLCLMLASYARAHRISLSKLVVFYAGEYVGISRSKRRQYFELLHQDFFSKVDILPENIHVLNGNAKDLNQECLNYEKKIKSYGGMNLFIGSLGVGGEIAFNVPGSSLKSRTRLKTLSNETLKADARFFGNDTTEVPHQAITMGLGTIFDAQEILILVYGVHKAFVVRACLEDAISEMNPASIFQLHPKSYFMVDKVAGRLLRVLINTEYINEEKSS